MKKILYLFLVLSVASAFAVEFKLEGEEGRMPTDEEIMQVINKYDFSPEQKEYLFKETKKQLQAAQQGGGEGAMNLFSDEGSAQTQQSTKKYTSHPPLTRRSARTQGLQ